MVDITNTVPAGKVDLLGTPNMRFAILKNDRHLDCFMCFCWHLCKYNAFILLYQTILRELIATNTVLHFGFNVESFAS